MADERAFETTINLGGLVIPVEVEFTVESYGSGPSGYGFDGSFDPGDPPEFHVTRVVALDTGVDLTASCDRQSLDIDFLAVKVPDPGQDPIRAVLFGLRSEPWRTPPTPFLPYRTTFTNRAGTILEGIESAIMMDASALPPPEWDDYDPRDWE